MESDDPDMVTVLANAGAKVEAVDDDGLTPLMRSCLSGKPKAMKALLECKASAEGTGPDVCTCC